MENNFNNKIRKTIKDMIENYQTFLSLNFYSNKMHDEINNLYIGLLNNSEEILTELEENGITKKEIISTMSLIIMIKNQMYIDHYKNLNLKSKLETAENYEKIDLETLKINNNLEGRMNLYQDSNINLANDMLNSVLMYKNKSIYNKILEIKALNIDDIKILVEINPFIKKEIEMYNLKIDKEFIIDRISKLNRGIFKENPNKIYKETLDFIYNLEKINKTESQELVNELIIESDLTSLNFNDKNDTISSKYGSVSRKTLNKILTEITTKEDKKNKLIKK